MYFGKPTIQPLLTGRALMWAPSTDLWYLRMMKNSMKQLVPSKNALQGVHQNPLVTKIVPAGIFQLESKPPLVTKIEFAKRTP